MEGEGKKYLLLLQVLLGEYSALVTAMSHGTDIPHISDVWKYIIGFTITTLGLHVIRAVGGLLILEEKSGRKHLRALGAVTSFIGIYLLLRERVNLWEWEYLGCDKFC